MAIDWTEDYDTPCPHCSHEVTRWRDCDAVGCDDGEIDEYEDDPLWFEPGDTSACEECDGTGTVCWCPKCGADPRDPVNKENS